MDTLQKLFKDRDLPQTLVALYLFDKGCKDEYAQHFRVIPEDNMCEFMYPGDERISSKIIEFAQGGEYLASYALWIPDGVSDEEQMPVVFLDSGSGVNLMAPNLKDFLVLLSYDVDCSGDFFYKECEDYEPSPYHQLYCEWLKNTMQLDPISECSDDRDEGYHEVKKITEKAKEKFGDEFNRWLYKIENDDIEKSSSGSINTTTIDAPLLQINSFNDLINLLYLRMDDTKILGALDSLNIKRPILDGNYLKEKNIYLSNDDESFYTIFRDIESREQSDLSRPPYLLTAAISKKSNITPPFGITFDDDYKKVVEKIGKEAEYQHCISDEMKIWILKTPNTQKEYEFTVDFNDEETLDYIFTIIISDEDPENRVDNLA